MMVIMAINICMNGHTYVLEKDRSVEAGINGQILSNKIIKVTNMLKE